MCKDINHEPLAMLRYYVDQYPSIGIGILRDVFAAGARAGCYAVGRDLPVDLEFAIYDDSRLPSSPD